MFTSISVAVCCIVLTLLLSVEIYQSPEDLRPGSIATKPQAALYSLVLFDVAIFIWLFIKLALVFHNHLSRTQKTVAYTQIRHQKGSEMEDA